MSYVRKPKKRPLLDQVNKFIGEFTDLIYDGAQIICLVCNKPLLCWDKTDCRKHVNSAQHKYKKSGTRPRAEFMFDLIFMLMSCNLPFTLLNQQAFRHFWDKYTPTMKLPGRKTLQTYVPAVREQIENNIKYKLCDKKLWLCVDETTDCKNNYIVNVVVRTLETLKPSCAFLLASKRLEKRTSEEITMIVLNSLEKFQLSRNQVFMFVTDDATIMHSVALCLKEKCGSFLHITCKLHALHLMAEEIQKHYPAVNGLILSTEAVFLKHPERIREFHREYPGIPKPPQSTLNHWGTWLQAAVYYFKHFHKIKSVVLQFDPKDAAAIKESQVIFQDPQVEADLQTIYTNYKGLVEAIEKLQNPSLSLVESLQILDGVHAQIHDLTDAENYSVIAKFYTVLKNDSDFTRLKQIYSATTSTDPLRNCHDYFKYANITSLDAKQSFSLHKKIFSPWRTSLTETTVETYLMLQMFNRANPADNTVNGQTMEPHFVDVKKEIEECTFMRNAI